MGKINQGILGGFSGGVGPVIGSGWKGINTMRSRATSVSNPRTAGQVSQRTKFAAAVELGSTLLGSIVKPLWDRFAVKESGYNAFIRSNVPAFSSLGVPTFASLVMSNGSLESVGTITATIADDESTLALAWTDNSGTGFALATDQLYFVAKGDNFNFTGFSNVAVRGDESVSIELPETVFGGESLHMYFSWRRADGTIVSDSAYLLKVIA